MPEGTTEEGCRRDGDAIVKNDVFIQEPREDPHPLSTYKTARIQRVDFHPGFAIITPFHIKCDLLKEFRKKDLTQLAVGECFVIGRMWCDSGCMFDLVYW